MDKLRLIQCGVGGFGDGWVRTHVPASPDFDLAAIVDVSPKTLNDIGEALHIPPANRFLSLEDALKRVKADAVLTVTPPAVHVHHARLAFSNGLHLMTEKPIADTIENARLMVKLAQEAGRQLVVSQNYRFKSTVHTLRRLLATQAVGELGHGHLDFYIAADFPGTFRETMDFPLLIDMAIHHLDLIRAITGRNIVRVTAVSFRPSWSWYKHDPGLKMLLELEGGLAFSYSGDWTAKGRFTAWDGHWRLQCAHGAILWEGEKLTLTRSSTWFKDLAEESITPEPIPLFEQAYTLHSFAEAIRTGVPAETSGADNLHSFAAVMAGVKSVQEKRSVDVAELLM